MMLQLEPPTKFCGKYFDRCYDIIAVMISIFDITTDIWILVEWYYQDRIIFFGISLTILILANFGAAIVFYGRNADPNAIGFFFFGCCLLPFGPFLSFTIYFLEICGVTDPHNYWDKPSTSRKWMEDKLSKHVGFLLEAIMEAFPQCVLQMIAIMYFNELHIISIISVIVSMLSISSKSLILSAALSINIKTMLFTWFYAVSDFFSIFFVLSFVFYGGEYIDINTIEIIRNIWLYKIYIFTIPTCFICSLPTFVWGFKELSYGLDSNNIYSIRNCLVFLVMFMILLPLWALGMILGTMILEILCYTYIAVIVYKLGHGRIPSVESANTWNDIIDWIKGSNSNDAIRRICCVNRQLLLMKNNDDKLNKYLEEKEHSTQYGDVTYASIRRLYTNILWQRFSNTFIWKAKEKHIAAVVVNIVLFYYMISRIITLLFPYLIIIMFAMNGQSIIYDLPLFQMTMLFIMLVMIFIMIILFVIIYKEERTIFYILPLRSRLYEGINDFVLTMIESYYDRLIIKPYIKQALCQIFGNDLGLLMFQFMPFGLEEEEHAKKLTEKAATYTQEHRSQMTNSIQYAMFRRRAI